MTPAPLPVLQVQDVVKSEADCRLVITQLMECSQWFAITPLPDDCWRITVKSENAVLLNRILAETILENDDE